MLPLGAEPQREGDSLSGTLAPERAMYARVRDASDGYRGVRQGACSAVVGGREPGDLNRALWGRYLQPGAS